MKITGNMLADKLLDIAKKNAPVRLAYNKKGEVITKTTEKTRVYTKAGRPMARAVGKKDTNMYSPYPGNLKNNGIVRTENGVKFDYDKVGYIGYANIRSHKPQFIERTVEDFCTWCVGLGGRIIKR
jgi:hypothetical protein